MWLMIVQVEGILLHVICFTAWNMLGSYLWSMQNERISIDQWSGVLGWRICDNFKDRINIGGRWAKGSFFRDRRQILITVNVFNPFVLILCLMARKHSLRCKWIEPICTGNIYALRKPKVWPINIAPGCQKVRYYMIGKSMVIKYLFPHIRAI